MAANKLCYITQGFREDCARLIARFERLETVRFDGFSEIWKDLKFSLVFAGRRSLIEQIEFCEDTLIVAKEFFLPPLSFKERIGGLYLLYALYFKMPVDGPKIRTRMEDWQDIIEIRAEIAQAEHHDASFILSKLMSENAFVHCALERELGLEKSYRLKVPRLRNTYSVLSDIRELAGPRDLFDRVNTLSEYYALNKASEMKELSDSSKGQSEYLELYDTRFGKKLLSAVERVENSRKFTNLGNVRGIMEMREARTNIDTSEKARNDPAKKSRVVSDPIRCRLGHGFDTDSSESENEEFIDQPGRNDLPDSPKFARVAGPIPRYPVSTRMVVVSREIFSVNFELIVVVEARTVASVSNDKTRPVVMHSSFPTANKEMGSLTEGSGAVKKRRR